MSISYFLIMLVSIDYGLASETVVDQATTQEWGHRRKYHMQCTPHLKRNHYRYQPLWLASIRQVVLGEYAGGNVWWRHSTADGCKLGKRRAREQERSRVWKFYW